MPTYVLDTTGINPNNLVVNEQHTITEVNNSPYRFIIPTFSPFYLDNFALKYDDGLGNETVLIEGVDYSLCMPYIGGSRSIGKMLYGGITIMNNYINGSIKVSYQTLGGDWVADTSYVLAILADLVYNPRITIWDIITNVQEVFPPINHDQSLDYVYGYQDLITAINNLADTIANAPTQSLSFVQHLLNENNPHLVTRQQLGLGSIINLPLATDLEVTNRSPVDKYVTLKQLVQLANL